MRRAPSYRSFAALALLGAIAAPAVPAWAEKVFTGPGLARREAQPGALSAMEIQEKVGFDQKLGASLPLDLEFRDETGKGVRLGDYFGERPVLLALVYYRCPVLCMQTAIGVAASMKTLPYSAGEEFDVVFASFDPTDTPELAAEKKAAMLARLGDPAAAPGVHFLTGDATNVARLAESVGFRYAYDETTRQYAHASGVVALTADGRVSRYLYGVEYAPKDLKLALFEAGEGKIGGLSEKLMLLCFNYDAALGKYTAGTMISLKIAATLTLVALFGSIFWMLRGERRNTKKLRGGDAPVEGAAPV
jgi:protein SCO1/2